jgi:type I restriction enzyme S subunit
VSGLSEAQSWLEIFIPDVAQISTGKVDANHASINGKYKFYTCAYEPLLSDTFSFNDELIILPGNGANVGHVEFYKGKIEAYQRTYVLHEIAICPRYLYWHLKRFWKEVNLEKQYGSATNYIKMGNFTEYKLPLAPLAEQQQIAQKLDELLAQVDTLKTRLDAIPKILKRFRQSVLAAAVSGRLTEGSDHWSIGKVGDIVEKIEAGKNLQCIEMPPQKDQYGIVKISAVTWGIYDEKESKTLPDFDLFMESRRIQVGDFLISRANTIELLGNPVIVHRATKNLMLSDKVLRLVMRTEDKYWLSIFLRSHFGRKQIEEKSTGNQMSMRNIGQKALLDIDIPKPPLEEQTEIVRRVEQLFAYADQIEQRVKDAQARVNHLTQSILAKAFRGELTADWRAQNPELISGGNSAAALLERIKAEREATAKPKRKIKA